MGGCPCFLCFTASAAHGIRSDRHDDGNPISGVKRPGHSNMGLPLLSAADSPLCGIHHGALIVCKSYHQNASRGHVESNAKTWAI